MYPESSPDRDGAKRDQMNQAWTLNTDTAETLATEMKLGCDINHTASQMIVFDSAKSALLLFYRLLKNSRACKLYLSTNIFL